MPTDPSSSSPEIDPYADQPSFFLDHAKEVWAVVVGLSTALLTALIFPPFNAPEFASAFAVPAIFWAYTRPSFKLFAWTMLAAQAVAWTFLLGWLHNVTWLGLVLLGPFVGAWVGLWYLAAWWTMPRMLGKPTSVRLLAVLGLAGAWVVLEWTRTWFLSGFPWLPLAASQWQRVAMLQVASFTGSWGVSFVLVSVNVGFAAYAHRLFREGKKGLHKRSQEFFLALFLVLCCFSIHVQETFNRGRFMSPVARVAFTQPYIPQEIKWDESRGKSILGILEQTTLEAAKTRPDLILWPEATTPWAMADTSTREWVESLTRRSNATLLLGAVSYDKNASGETWRNSVFVVDPKEGLAPSSYAKRHLVPFGEYVPLRPVLGWLKKFVPIGDGDFQPGLDASTMLVGAGRNNYVVGPLLCYEDVYPQLARRSVLAGAEILTVHTNNGWFGEGSAAYQHAAHSVLRAVETRRPVLRIGNGGWSGWIDEFGNTRAVLTKDAENRISSAPNVEDSTVYFRGTATVAVTRDSRWAGKESYYVEHGDWFVLVSAGLAIFSVMLLGLAEPKPFVPPPEEND